jgi:hypothetical protein
MKDQLNDREPYLLSVNRDPVQDFPANPYFHQWSRGHQTAQHLQQRICWLLGTVIYYMTPLLPWSSYYRRGRWKMAFRSLHFKQSMKDSVGINLGEWMLIPAIRSIVVWVTSVGCMHGQLVILPQEDQAGHVVNIVQRVLRFLGWPATNQQN